MRRSPLFNFSITLSGRIADSFLMFFFYSAVARSLGKENFGIFFFSVSIAFFLISISDFGFSSYIIREMANNRQKGLQIFSEIIGFRVIAAILFIVLAWCIGHFVFEDASIRNTVSLLTLGGGIYFIGDFYLDIFRGNEQMNWVVSFTFLYKIILAALGLSFLDRGYGLNGLIVAYAIAGVFFSVLCSFATNIIYGSIIPSLHLKDAVKTIRESWALAVPKILGSLNIKIGLYFLYFFSTKDNVGIFGASLRLMEALLFIPWTMFTVAFPYFVRLSRFNTSVFENGVRTILKIMIGIIFPITLAIQILSEKIILVIYGQNFISSSSILRVHMWVCTFYFISSIFAMFLQSTYHHKTVAILSTASLFLHAVLALLLIHWRGAMGAVFSAFFTELLLMLVCFLIYNRKFNLFNLFKGILKIVFPAFGTMAILFLLREKSLFIILPVGGVSYLSLLLLFKPLSAFELSWLRTNLATLHR